MYFEKQSLKMLLSSQAGVGKRNSFSVSDTIFYNCLEFLGILLLGCKVVN